VDVAHATPPYALACDRPLAPDLLAHERPPIHCPVHIRHARTSRTQAPAAGCCQQPVGQAPSTGNRRRAEGGPHPSTPGSAIGELRRQRDAVAMSPRVRTILTDIARAGRLTRRRQRI
jgi:hypothetical protein